MDLNYYKKLLNKFLTTKLSETDILEINEQKGGLFNKVYKITVNHSDTYYYKQYLDKEVSTIFTPPKIPSNKRAELAFIVHKKAEDFNIDINTVPNIFFDKESNTLIIRGIDNPIVMIDDISKNRVSLSHAKLIAKTISRLHKELATDNYRNNDLFLNEEFRDFKLKLQYYDLAEKFDKKIKDSIHELVEKYTRDRMCALHGDLNSRNIIINGNNNQKIGIIDFEQSHVGNPIYDISYFLCEIFISCVYFDKISLLKDYFSNFLKEYSLNNPNYNLSTHINDFKQHLAVQILYRFYGPSRDSWTFYVEDENKLIINYLQFFMCFHNRFFAFWRNICNHIILVKWFF